MRMGNPCTKQIWAMQTQWKNFGLRCRFNYFLTPDRSIICRYFIQMVLKLNGRIYQTYRRRKILPPQLVAVVWAFCTKTTAKFAALRLPPRFESVFGVYFKSQNRVAAIMASNGGDSELMKKRKRNC